MIYGSSALNTPKTPQKFEKERKNTIKSRVVQKN
jgi:hypothetical protein